jgi:hypothetical protein
VLRVVRRVSAMRASLLSELASWGARERLDVTHSLTRPVPTLPSNDACKERAR